MAQYMNHAMMDLAHGLTPLQEKHKPGHQLPTMPKVAAPPRPTMDLLKPGVKMAPLTGKTKKGV